MATADIAINNPNLWRLISPALPVGAFQYSQGLEQAVENAWVCDATTATNWIESLLVESIQCVDLPVVNFAYRAWNEQDHETLERIDAICLACRETSELRGEEKDMGLALGNLLRELGEPMPAYQLGYVATFAIAAVNKQIPLNEACAGYTWSWCENQVLNAVKLVPLGHVQGQKILSSLGDQIGNLVDKALTLPEQDIGRSAYGATIASCQHETMPSRLYRS